MPATRLSGWQRPFLATLTLFVVFGAPRPAASQTRAYAFLPLANVDQAAVLDTTTNGLLPAIATGDLPTGVAVSHDGRRAYVVNQEGDSVTVIDVATMTPATTIPVGNAPYTIAVSPDDRKAYVTRPADDTVTVLDLTTNTSTGDIALPGLSPRGIAFAPDGQTAWVVGIGLRRIGVATNTAGPGMSLAGAADAVAVSQDGMTAFVTLPGLDAIQPVGITTAETTIAVGDLTGPDRPLAGRHDALRDQSGVEHRVRRQRGDQGGGGDDSGRERADRYLVPHGRTARLRRQRQRQHGLGHRHGDPHRRRLAGRWADLRPASGGPFVTPPLIVPTGGPLVVPNDAALDGLGFRRYLPFLGGTFQVEGPVSIITSRHLSLLAPGGTIDTNSSGLQVLGDISGPGDADGHRPRRASCTLDGHEHSRGRHGGARSGFLVIDGTHTPPIALNHVSAQLRGTGTVGTVTVTAGGIVAWGFDARPVARQPGDVRAGQPARHRDKRGDALTARRQRHGRPQRRASERDRARGAGPRPAAGHRHQRHRHVRGSAGRRGAPWCPPRCRATAATAISYVGGDGNDVTATKLNDPPYFLGTIAAQTTSEGVPLVLPINVDDFNHTASVLTVTATSSNQAIVPDGTGLIVTGSPMPPAHHHAGDRHARRRDHYAGGHRRHRHRHHQLRALGPRAHLLPRRGRDRRVLRYRIAIANPNPQTALFEATFLKPDGTTVVRSGGLAAHQQTIIGVDFLTGLVDAAFSTVVSATNGQPLVVERTMRWGATRYGAHTEKAAAGAARDVVLRRRIAGLLLDLLPAREPAADGQRRPGHLLPRERAAAAPDLPAGRALADHDRRRTKTPSCATARSARASTFDLAGAAERAMYFGSSPLWQGGHASFGTPAPSTTWFLAEGATGTLLHDVRAARQPERPAGGGHA